MAVKLALLKSGEEVISDVREARKEDSEDVLFYVFNSPYVVNLVQVEQTVLNEGAEMQGNEQQLNFRPWITLSKDQEIYVQPDWVVTFVETYEDVVKAYTERVGV
jgi:hypothetical protein